MWKLAAFVLIGIFVIADSIYLYFRLKKYWRRASAKRRDTDRTKWKIGLPSLPIPLNKKKDEKNHLPEKP